MYVALTVRLEGRLGRRSEEYGLTEIPSEEVVRRIVAKAEEANLGMPALYVEMRILAEHLNPPAPRQRHSDRERIMRLVCIELKNYSYDDCLLFAGSKALPIDMNDIGFFAQLLYNRSGRGKCTFDDVIKVLS